MKKHTARDVVKKIKILNQYLSQNAINFTSHEITLEIISDVWSVDFFDKIIELDCFNSIIFGKKICRQYNNLTKLSNPIKYVIFKGFRFDNIKNLPSNIEIIKLKLKYKEIKLFDIPQGIKKIIIEEDKSRKILYSNDVLNIDKILHIGGFNSSLNYHHKLLLDLYELDGQNISIHLNYMCNNTLINFIDLPPCIESIQLYDGFDKTLDYLPNTIKKIVFNSNINTKLSNLPSSVKYVSFYRMKLTDICKIYELPDSVETIYLDLIYFVSINLTYLPKKIKLIQIEKSNVAYKIINHINAYKKLNNLNFAIELAEHSLTRSLTHLL